MEYDAVFTRRGQSYAYAVNAYPDALAEEFAVAAEMCAADAGQTVINIPGACVDISRYLPRGVHYAAYETNVTFARLAELPTCTWTSIPVASASADRVLSLASLHHADADERRAFYTEVRRVLRPNGGAFIIGDVVAQSPQAAWLNEFVNTWNSVGHTGKFWSEADVGLLKECGFTTVETTLRTYRWGFKDRHEMTDFCRHLFGLDKADDATIYSGLQTYLSATETGFDWTLVYFNAKVGQVPSLSA